MRNPDDHEAGWTKKTKNPKTGKYCSGGAARNLKIAQAGGVVSLQASAFFDGAQQAIRVLKPYKDAFEHFEAQLKKLNVPVVLPKLGRRK